MQLLNTITALRTVRQQLSEAGRPLALVPTMGALHNGHLSLVRAAKVTGSAVAVSIFVNPTQFGPNEDYTTYPRTFETDCALLEAEGVDLIFAPSAAEMYPHAATTSVHVSGISDRLDGASRPGHFDGVATIVAKLFHLVQPQQAFFGQKDAAQIAVLRAMVRDLNFPVELVVCPIVRELDGLAMSSRNRYLSPSERQQALVLSRALRSLEALLLGGLPDSRSAAPGASGTRTAPLLEAAYRVLAGEPAVRIDYLAAVDPATLLPVENLRSETLFAVAAHVGATRLIDNLVLAPRQAGS